MAYPKENSGKSHHSKVVNSGGTNVSLFFASAFTNAPISTFFKRDIPFCLSIITESAAKEREARHSGLEASLREALFQIFKFENKKTGHFPLIENLEGASFPFDITITR